MKMRFPAVFPAISLLISCSGPYTPKPEGYLRFDPPPVVYTELNISDLPYKFNISRSAAIEIPPADTAEYWINITYPQWNAKIYCSFETITPQTLDDFTTDCRKLVSRTVHKASAINEKMYENADNKVYATLFEMEGETASPLQFMLTDSLSRFFRGALYFECKPNVDSLTPYTEFLRNDVIELIQTFEWK